MVALWGQRETVTRWQSFFNRIHFNRNFMKYSEKLKDPRWQKKRLEIFNRDNFQCQRCGSKEDTLTVHHKKYNEYNPWDCNSGDLITLCFSCHDIFHKNKHKYSSNKYLPLNMMADLTDIYLYEYALYKYVDLHGIESLTKYIKSKING